MTGYNCISITNLSSDHSLWKLTGANITIDELQKLTYPHRLAALQDHRACKLCLMGSCWLELMRRRQMFVFSFFEGMLPNIIWTVLGVLNVPQNVIPLVILTTPSLPIKQRRTAYHTEWCGSSSEGKLRPEHRRQHKSANLCTPQ